VDPHLALDLDRLQPIEGWPGIEWGGVWGILGDPYQKDGAVPLPDGAVETIGELIRELAASDPDPKVRSQAWWLPRRLRSGDRDHHRDECRLANQVHQGHEEAVARTGGDTGCVGVAGGGLVVDHPVMALLLLAGDRDALVRALGLLVADDPAFDPIDLHVVPGLRILDLHHIRLLGVLGAHRGSRVAVAPSLI
jgi:hypothetical protein